MTSSPIATKQDSAILARAGSPAALHVLAWGLVGLGALLRIVQYASDRPLWLDEALLSLNIVDRSFGDLLEVLNFQQGAPPGFLFTEKLATLAFGESEYALRLFPLLCGLASLPIFLTLARKLLAPPAVVMAVAGFALLDPLIYYSSEVKQYSTDVVVALLVWSASVSFLARRRRIDFVWLGLAGILAILFSHAALLVLGSVAVVLLVIFGRDGSFLEVRRLIATLALCGAVLGFAYVLALRHLGELRENIVGGTSPYSAPLPPTSAEDLAWFREQGSVIFETMIGWSTPVAIIAGVFFLLGAVVHARRDGAQSALLLLPVVVTLAASGLDLYPFGRRFVLFLFPLVPLFVAEAAYWLIGLRYRSRLVALGSAVVLTVILGQQAERAAREVRSPVRREDIPPVLSHVDQHWQTGDRLYVYYAAQYAFRFYAGRFRTPPWPIVSAPDDEDQFAPALVSQPPELVIGSYARDDREIYLEELQRLDGSRRVWILFSHVVDGEDELMLRHLDRLGTQVDRFETRGAAAYLYDLGVSDS